MTSLGPLSRSPLVDQATQRLRVQIAGGHWPVGTRLPGETTLAKELGVGRSTVREAIRALSGAGLLAARQGSGVYVIATEPVEDWPARLRRAAVVDLYEVRTMVEVRAARIAAARRTDEDLAAMDLALARRRRAAKEAGDAEFVDADIALHTAVVAAGRNPLLTGLFADFAPVLRRGLIDLMALVDLRAHDPALGDDSHAALVEAVRAGDPDRAGQIIERELEDTLRLLQRETS
ncbi:FadR/GntR family transcriptional regulator [Nonomuraea roseoviolacea]|uniref:DNA-binding FadR family transcriptional regulator n=1 Tax=Nonomuraea roseoviolacea subsp. carminata TaxID=160689 RepID=A0ABT1K2S6_9ACTN|nr:FCD domain-containing protein [Nonomuraea roseoviolacea]MCP2348287.1 DNA-binding FadR family transcriptional regulator [Nonomuraea roseoviolacea subsp. carminata]